MKCEFCKTAEGTERDNVPSYEGLYAEKNAVMCDQCYSVCMARWVLDSLKDAIRFSARQE